MQKTKQLNIEKIAVKVSQKKSLAFHSVTVCVFGIYLCCVVCSFSSSSLFLVSDRLSDDGMYE